MLGVSDSAALGEAYIVMATHMISEAIFAEKAAWREKRV
jgi:hypothetical protein